MLGGIHMPHEPVSSRHRNFAKHMRTDATKAENMLWQVLRRSQLEGLRFKRQVPINGRIVDFACFECRLIIEVDGGQHSGSNSDQKRDAHFAASGFRTLRFWNDDDVKNLDRVCREILIAAGRDG